MCSLRVFGTTCSRFTSRLVCATRFRRFFDFECVCRGETTVWWWWWWWWSLVSGILRRATGCLLIIYFCFYSVFFFFLLFSDSFGTRGPHSNRLTTTNGGPRSTRRPFRVTDVDNESEFSRRLARRAIMPYANFGGSFRFASRTHFARIHWLTTLLYIVRRVHYGS